MESKLSSGIKNIFIKLNTDTDNKSIEIIYLIEKELKII